MSEENFSYSNWSAIVGARTMIGIESLDYDHEIAVEVFHGKGSEPVGWGTGVEKGNGKMTITDEEYNKMVTLSAAYGGRVTKLPPFPITGIAKKETTSESFKEVLPLVKIKKVGHKRKVGDTKFLTDLDFELLKMPVRTRL